MRLLVWIYEKLTGSRLPDRIRKMSILGAIWKVIRKYICVSVVPFIPFNCLRIWGYRLVGFKIGKRVFIGMQCYLDDFDPSHLVIEDDVVISYRVTFACHGPRMHKRDCILRKGCYIGTNVTILGGTEIGPYATVGSCSLVRKDVPALTVVAGVPARVLIVGRTPWESDEHLYPMLAEKYLNKTGSQPSGSDGLKKTEPAGDSEQQ